MAQTLKRLVKASTVTFPSVSEERKTRLETETLTSRINNVTICGYMLFTAQSEACDKTSLGCQ